jgi:hypothetical protein
MSDTIIGVIVGGLIASVSPIITLYWESKRWKREKLVEQLRRDRSKLESEYQLTLVEIHKGIENNFYSTDMVVNALVLMPKPVATAIDNFISEKNRTKERLKNLYENIHIEMKVSLLKIDGKISNALGEKKEERGVTGL